MILAIDPYTGKVLAMANLVYADFESLYGGIEKLRGAAYYETVEGWLENKAYSRIPKMRKMRAREVREFGLTGKPMYESFLENPKAFEWLKAPQNYLDTFADLLE